MKMNKWIMIMYLISLMFPLSSMSWLNIWIGMETNLMMFILIMNKKKSMMMNESMMKYFLIQAIGSLMFLLSLSMNLMYYNEWPLIKAIIPPIALMMKVGLAPLHMWMPEIAKNFDNLTLFFFLTLQKINPLLILFSSWFNIMFYSSIINILVGSVMGINESLINKLLIFSSISNSGWMIISLMISNMMFYFMFTIYSLILTNLMLMNNFFKIKWMSQIKSNQLSKKLSIFLMFMSLSGLPPLLGFIPKWMIIKNMINFMPIFTWVFIIFSTLNMFFYMKSSMMMMMNSLTKKKWILNNKIKFNIISITVINFSGIPLTSLFF
uniref:NADH-ubiquinone oxidoreductase chain 2 n=1 Tax=Mesohomotoma hibisci TaxID=399243 RepID=A0A344A2J6_9HEMI|nr:NADH dehydrogenase subunit 2 [Mesohomotoma hibisci]